MILREPRPEQHPWCPIRAQQHQLQLEPPGCNQSIFINFLIHLCSFGTPASCLEASTLESVEGLFTLSLVLLVQLRNGEFISPILGPVLVTMNGCTRKTWLVSSSCNHLQSICKHLRHVLYSQHYHGLVDTTHLRGSRTFSSCCRKQGPCRVGHDWPNIEQIWKTKDKRATQYESQKHDAKQPTIRLAAGKLWGKPSLTTAMMFDFFCLEGFFPHASRSVETISRLLLKGSITFTIWVMSWTKQTNKTTTTTNSIAQQPQTQLLVIAVAQLVLVAFQFLSVSNHDLVGPWRQG